MFDCIVIGTGGVGSAAIMHLALRGQRVLGLDQFPRGHDRGSSHGQSRVIRLAYFEHPNYVPLLRAAYDLWDQLSADCEQHLFHRTGLLEVGSLDGIVVPGVLASAQEHRLPVERLTHEEARRRFPGFFIPDDLTIVFEENAGYLLVEDCVLAHLAMAERHGAELRTDHEVVSWRCDGSGVEVRTKHHIYRAARLVVTAGSWAGKLLADLNLPLRIVKKHLHWYQTTNDQYNESQGSPVFFYEVGKSFFYGFPCIDSCGVKIAEHGGGEEILDPLREPRNIDPEDRRRVAEFLSRYLPGVSQQPTHHAVCFYTMTPDEHFYVDRHPHHGQVVFAAGLSGHGFKFTSVLGKIMADLAIDGRTSLPIEFLSVSRSSGSE